MIKLTQGYMNLTSHDLVLFCGKTKDGIAILIYNEAKNASRFHRILFISLQNDKDTILKHHFFNQENTNIIDKPTTIKELKNYIEDYKPEYVYINNLELLDNIDYEDIKSKLENIKQVATLFNVGIMIASNSIKEKRNYLTEDYNSCKSVWIITEDKLDRVR